MIFEFFIGFFLEIINKGWDLIAFIQFPIDMISVLTPILAYGNAIVGLDIILIVIGSFIFWGAVKGSLGLALFLYEKIPFI